MNFAKNYVLETRRSERIESRSAVTKRNESNLYLLDVLPVGRKGFDSMEIMSIAMGETQTI